MDLRAKLKAMGVRPRAPGPPSPRPDGNGGEPSSYATPGESSVAVQVRPVVSRKQVSIDQALPGSCCETSEGACYAVERRYPVSHMRGPVPLGAILHSRPSVLWDAGRPELG